MRFALTSYLLCPPGHGTVLLMAWIRRLLPSTSTAKRVPVCGNRSDKRHGHSGNAGLRRPAPENHNSNPHSTTDYLNRVAASRGFLPWLVRRLPVKFACRLTQLRLKAGILQPLTN